MTRDQAKLRLAKGMREAKNGLAEALAMMIKLDYPMSEIDKYASIIGDMGVFLQDVVIDEENSPHN